MKRQGLSGYHPAVIFLYFVLVIGFGMTLMHPICQASSLLCGLVWFRALKREKSAQKPLWLLVMFAFTALLNPLFSHAGVTILCYLPSGNPLTLESILYGLCAAATLCCALVWFSCLNAVVSSDQILYLFGRVIPSLSLLLSMTLRFVPRFTAQLKTTAQTQKALGRDISTGSVVSRIRCAAQILSGVVTWSLENALDTADSMKSRGYGLRGRTAFSIYRFDSRDARLLAWLVFTGGYILTGALCGALKWQYYPSVQGAPIGFFSLSTMLIYAALGATPMILQRWEAFVWTHSVSGI